MLKLVYPPDSASYAVTPDAQVKSTKLDGGASRYRQEFINATSIIDATWTCNRGLLMYMTRFYRYNASQGGEIFTIDLCLDDTVALESQVHFVPGSMKIAASTSSVYTVTAQLELVPVNYTQSQMSQDLLWLTYVQNNSMNDINIIDMAINEDWNT